jgi:hypothetical protein
MHGSPRGSDGVGGLAPPSSANSLLANPIVAPAQAGAYRAFRVRPTDVMGPSLRWDDGGFSGEMDGHYCQNANRSCPYSIFRVK